MIVDPRLPENQDRPLWCVYGTVCFPTMFCCKILNHPEYGAIIWGYSFYRGEPGFRTLGQQVDSWMQELTKKFGWKLFEFYNSQTDAINRIVALTTPAAGS